MLEVDLEGIFVQPDLAHDRIGPLVKSVATGSKFDIFRDFPYSTFMAIAREMMDRGNFNEEAILPYSLRLEDFLMAMQDVYDFFHDVNSNLEEKRIRRLDDILRPAMMSGFLSDLLTASLANHSRVLTLNRYFNGHPDLIVDGVYPGNAVKSGEEGVEVKATRKSGGAVDTHGARGSMDVRLRLRGRCLDRTCL